MSSHPGSTLKDAIALAEYLNEHRLNPQQVQDYYPTPGTISTCMYYTHLDPETMKPVYVTDNPHEKAMQRALIQYRSPANYDLVKEALLKEGRKDLIGFGRECLIPPRRPAGEKPQAKKADSRSGGKSRDNNSERGSRKNERGSRNRNYKKKERR